MVMLIRVVALLVLVLALSGCATNIDTRPDQNSDLTQGNVQLNLVVGQTKKSDVLEVFGAPNITTRDGSGREVWSYQRQAQVSRSSQESGYATLILFGTGSRSSGFETSSRMMTLIIKFDAMDVVIDFSSRTSNF
jgi:outer membrane protein assembly factor BamE (lipoprotein component of BamABCDE complex)